MPPDRCNNCKFWKKPEDEDKLKGNCRFNPPVLLAYKSAPHSTSIKSYWPSTEPKDWCGKHKKDCNA